MFIKINYKHLKSTDALNAVTHRKSEKLKKYFDGKLNLEWSFTVEKQNHIAHCHVTGNHREFFAEATTSSIYSSIDEVISALDRQIRKNKELIRNHHVSA